MQKKGVAEILGSLVILVILFIGTLASYTVISENRYVGDKTTLKVYDLKDCNLDFIDKENRISFSSLMEAKENGYNLGECK